MTSPEPLTTVSLSDPGDLIAVTPVLLGFVPRSSLIAMSLGGASGRRLGLTLRIDLPPPEHVAGGRDRRRRRAPRPPVGRRPHRRRAGWRCRAACRRVRRADHGGPGPARVEACHALWTESTAAGSRWRCYGECACTGWCPGRAPRRMAAAARAEGRVVRADREELERLVAPVDERVLRRAEALLIARRRRRGRRHLRGVRRPRRDPRRSPRPIRPAARGRPEVRRSGAWTGLKRGGPRGAG